MNVYDATQERLKLLFEEFEQVCIAFSGGKDSGVCLNLAVDYAKKTNQLEKLAVYHLDYEAQYQFTTDYVMETFERLPEEVGKYWLCLPVKVPCATSMFQNHWVPWEREKKNLWVREMPDVEYLINEDNCEFDFDGWDYDVQERFCEWIGKDKNVCVVVGIRTQESLNRQAAITSKNKVNQHNGLNWATNKDGYVIAYPIYDWTTEDIWTCYARYDYRYNRVYDLMYNAGLSIHQMRVASPFLGYGKSSLKLYKVLDPNNWGRMISRVNGVNFTGLYGGTTAMGWKTITKPDHLTWKEYMYFLLDTLPEETKHNYLDKLEVSIKFWREKGGALSDEIIQELDDLSIQYQIGNHNYRTKKRAVKLEYLDDADVSDFKAIPTYKRMCVCIMKNDTTCKYMGFAQTKAELQRRKEAVEKYESIL